MRFLTLFIIFFNFNAFSYVPTVESLFRNANNPEVTTNALVLNLSIKKVDNQSVTPAAVKLVYNSFNDSSLKLTQLLFSTESFSDAELLDKKYMGSFTTKNFHLDNSLEKGLLFASLNTLLINDSGLMLEYLKELGVGVKYNDELIVGEKMQLINRYKNFLGKPSEINPLRPENDDERKKIEKIMKESFYNKSNLISFGKWDNFVGWNIRDEKFEAFFENHSRKLLRLSYKTEKGTIEIIYKDYILYDGIHSFPRYIYLRDQDNISWVFETKSLRFFQENMNEMLVRIKKYDDALKGKEAIKHECSFLF
jgi:hypothetical protein